MSQLPLPSQQMPAREPALDRQEDLDDRDDCVEIEPPRLGVPMKQKQQRAAALEKDPLFGATPVSLSQSSKIPNNTVANAAAKVSQPT